MVTVAGTGFTADSTVHFGAAASGGHGGQCHLARATPPARTAGPVEISVTTPGGTSALVPGADPSPTTSSRWSAPSARRRGPRRGTVLTVTGSGFASGPTTVTFGPTAAIGVSVTH